MKKGVLLLYIVHFLALLSCDENPSRDERASFDGGSVIASLHYDDLSEASGIAASRKNMGMLWAHNDSGNDPSLFLLDMNGEIKTTYKFKENIMNRDWEDMAIGPGNLGDENMIYIADIGDNFSMRDQITVYRFLEPQFSNQQEVEIENTEVINLRYPDRAHDAETIFIDPIEKAIVIITKRETNVLVFSAPIILGSDKVYTLDSVCTLPFSNVTAGDITSNGSELLLKTYTDVYYFKREPADELLIEMLQHDPSALDYQPEPQGESIAWDATGSGFYTLSEKSWADLQQLYFHKRIN